ncbi:MAG: galactose ABC transporter substrate-binding protein [Oscillospiraceae bacterium]
MKRSLTGLLAALVLVTATGCGGEKTEDALRIGLAVYKGNDTYISSMTAALQASADDYCRETGAHIYVTMSDAQESQATQNDQIDRFLSLDYDVLCVNLVDRTDAGRVIDKARAADVPVVFFNREPVLEDLKTWDSAYYVGSDARESAVLQAGIVLELWRENPAALDTNGDGVLQYIMLEGESRHQDAIIRTEVSVQTLKDAGVPLERVDGGIADWDRSQAAALTEGYFKAHPGQIELILANNDDMALGAADAAAQLGVPFHNIVGIDGTPQGMEAVESGKMLGTVVMDYSAHGATIFRMALALATGAEVSHVAEVRADRSVRIPMQTLLTPNLHP